jgi:predicted RNase H-like HicB family nuclease
MVAVTKPTYTAVFEMDHTGWWYVSVPELPGCHSQGRTLAKARARIREALGLWLDVDEDAFELVEDIHLPEEARRVAAEARAAREHAHQAQRDALATTKAAARTLAQGGRLGIRDVAELLGLSHQRVAELLADQPERRPA